jgi:hypothetical protein
MTEGGLRKPVVVGTKIYLRFPELGDLKEFIALNVTSKRLHRGLASPLLNLNNFAHWLRNVEETTL